MKLKLQIIRILFYLLKIYVEKNMVDIHLIKANKIQNIGIQKI